MFECIHQAVRAQHYEGAYFFQSIPVVGAIISVPTAVVSCAMAIAKAAQAVFKHFKDGVPFFRPTNGTDRNAKQLPMEDAIDFSVIFANNVLNIFTFGIVNSIFVNRVLGELSRIYTNPENF